MRAATEEGKSSAGQGRGMDGRSLAETWWQEKSPLPEPDPGVAQEVESTAEFMTFEVRGLTSYHSIGQWLAASGEDPAALGISG